MTPATRIGRDSLSQCGQPSAHAHAASSTCHRMQKPPPIHQIKTGHFKILAARITPSTNASFINNLSQRREGAKNWSSSIGFYEH
jgi:hypothetical protein